MQTKKTFDPRHKGMANPFVQAYLEKQAEKSKPLSERQKLINVLLLAGLVLNLSVLGIVGWSTHATHETAVTTAIATEGDQALSMGEAMERIRALDANVQNMRSAVEFHKNAYFKLEQDHETLKSVLAQIVPAGNEKDLAANYWQRSLAMQTLPNPRLESPEANDAVKQTQAMQSQIAAEVLASKGSQQSQVSGQ